jgi:predicted AAA+ superfamily ATPase
VLSRNSYIAQLAPFLGKPVIKVITGMRRSGKSFLLRQIVRHLRDTGVPDANIVYVDKEDYAFDAIRDYHDLAAHVAEKLRDATGPVTICVDEVQEIDGWERIIASLAAKPDHDIIVTGSNARLLSSELATLIAGRYIEFQVRPLSFAEFLQFRGKSSAAQDAAALADEFDCYMRFGGMPGLHSLGELAEPLTRPFLAGIYDTIILKDVVRRHNIRNMDVFERILRFVFDNTGNLLNASRIAAFLKNQRIRISVDTVLTQLGWLTEARLAEPARIFDLKGKRYLKINEKYFPTDFGLKHAVLGYRPNDVGGLLENIVFLELRRRGYAVSVGRIGDAEIDFVAERANERAYYQVAFALPNNETLERELRPLEAVADNFPKFLLTMDRARTGNNNGVAVRYLPEWLLNLPVG